MIAVPEGLFEGFEALGLLFRSREVVGVSLWIRPDMGSRAIAAFRYSDRGSNRASCFL